MLQELDAIADRERINDIVLKMFWNPENDNETIGEMKEVLRRKCNLDHTRKDLDRTESYYQRKYY